MGDVPVGEIVIGPGLPALRIGNGPRPLAMIPALSLQVGIPSGRGRTLATSGWGTLVERYTVTRLSRRVRPVGTTFGQMAEDVALALEELGPPVDVIGGSTGGPIALHVAAARPDLVRRLVLVVTGVQLSPEGEQARARMFAAASAGRWGRLYGEVFTLGGASPLVRAALFAFGRLLGPRLVGIPSDPTLILSELDAWRRYDAHEVAPSISTPTLVIGTERDRLFPPSTTRELARLLPNGTAVVVPRLAHTWPKNAVSAHIAPFLD